MNKRGTAFIETLIILPTMLMALFLCDESMRGFSHRIRNRMMARYAATYYFRNGYLPSAEYISHMFDLPDDVRLTYISSEITTSAMLSYRNKELTLKNFYFLYNHEGIP